MPLTLLVGGARSGKSSLAVRMANAQSKPVVFVATAEAGDDEMAKRIERHRDERPDSWQTIEEPVELERTLAKAPTDACVIVDCLTLWLSNVHDRPDEHVLIAARRAVRTAAARVGHTIAVSNEVGSGIVPADAVVRRFRDLLGQVNALWAAEAHVAALVVAGRVLPLSPPETLLSR